MSFSNPSRNTCLLGTRTRHVKKKSRECYFFLDIKIYLSLFGQIEETSANREREKERETLRQRDQQPTSESMQRLTLSH